MGIDPISIGIMAAGTIISAVGSVNGVMSQQREQRAKQRQADLQAQNARLDQVRQGRIARARIVQAGANQGAGESSSVTTGASGATNQADSNIQYINDQQNVNNAILSAQRGQVNAQGLQALGNGITNIGGTIFSNDRFIDKKAKDIFGG